MADKKGKSFSSRLWEKLKPTSTVSVVDVIMAVSACNRSSKRLKRASEAPLREYYKEALILDIKCFFKK